MSNSRFPAGERRYWPPPAKASAACFVCWTVYLKESKRSDSAGYNWVQLELESDKCLSCLGTRREPIPFAELFVTGVKGDFL